MFNRALPSPAAGSLSPTHDTYTHRGLCSMFCGLCKRTVSYLDYYRYSLRYRVVTNNCFPLSTQIAPFTSYPSEASFRPLRLFHIVSPSLPETFGQPNLLLIHWGSHTRPDIKLLIHCLLSAFLHRRCLFADTHHDLLSTFTSAANGGFVGLSTTRSTAWSGQAFRIKLS
jgi:hypothetical protein